MSRTVVWRKNNNGSSPYWTAKTSTAKYWRNYKVDFSLVVESGRARSFVNKHAKLIIKKKTKVNGKTITTILVEKEFKSSYSAKLIVDSLLNIAAELCATQEEAEEFVINTLKNHSNLDKPEVTTEALLYRHGKGYEI